MVYGGGLSAFRLDESGLVSPPADWEDMREDWVLLLLDENQADTIVRKLTDWGWEPTQLSRISDSRKTITGSDDSFRPKRRNRRRD